MSLISNSEKTFFKDLLAFYPCKYKGASLEWFFLYIFHCFPHFLNEFVDNDNQVVHRVILIHPSILAKEPTLIHRKGWQEKKKNTPTTKQTQTLLLAEVLAPNPWESGCTMLRIFFLARQILGVLN